MTDVQLTMSLTTLFQGAIAIVLAVIGWFIKREFASMDEARKAEKEARNRIYAVLNELQQQRSECLKIFATKENMKAAYARLEHHAQELGHIQGWQQQHDKRHEED